MLVSTWWRCQGLFQWRSVWRPQLTRVCEVTCQNGDFSREEQSQQNIQGTFVLLRVQWFERTCSFKVLLYFIHDCIDDRIGRLFLTSMILQGQRELNSNISRNETRLPTLLLVSFGASLKPPPEEAEEQPWDRGSFSRAAVACCWVTWGWVETPSFFTLQRCCSPGPTDCPTGCCGTFQQTWSHKRSPCLLLSASVLQTLQNNNTVVTPSRLLLHYLVHFGGCFEPIYDYHYRLLFSSFCYLLFKLNIKPC